MKKAIIAILITFGVTFLLFCILVGVGIYQGIKTEQKLNKEVEEITNILESTDFDEEKLKKKLNTTISTGDYYKVERAYKNYVRDYLAIRNDIIYIYNNISVAALLSPDNLKSDGKDFINSKLLISAYRNRIDKLKVKLDSMNDEKKVLSYLDSSLSSYYVEYYREIVGDIKQTEKEKEISEHLLETSKILENIYNIFEFLSQNRNSWSVENDKVVFTDEALMKQYQELINNITSTNSSPSET